VVASSGWWQEHQEALQQRRLELLEGVGRVVAAKRQALGAQRLGLGTQLGRLREAAALTQRALAKGVSAAELLQLRGALLRRAVELSALVPVRATLL
jgi:hypothetical protein